MILVTFQTILVIFDHSFMGCAFFTAVHVVTCAYANFNPLYSWIVRARAGLIVGAGSSSYNS